MDAVEAGAAGGLAEVAADGLEEAIAGELGDKVESPDAADVPVKMGLALLRDMSGDITINLPVKGDLNDPKFSIGGIVMQAFLGLIVKAIASGNAEAAGRAMFAHVMESKERTVANHQRRHPPNPNAGDAPHGRNPQRQRTKLPSA